MTAPKGLVDLIAVANCNFRCDYCISKSNKEKNPIYMKENGEIDFIDVPEPSGIYESNRTGAPYGRENYVRWVLDQKKVMRDKFLDVDKTVEYVRKNFKDYVIAFSGGEPLIYPYIDRFIIELCETNPVILHTNGSLIRNHAGLLDIPSDHLVWRIGFHPEYRTMEEFKKTIKTFKDSNAKFIVNYMVHPRHIENGTFDKNIEFLNGIGIDYETTRFEGEYKGERYGLKCEPRVWEENLDGSKLLDCDLVPGDSFFAVLSTGEVFNCHNYAVSCGNIYTGRFERIPCPCTCSVKCQSLQTAARINVSGKGDSESPKNTIL